MKAGKAQGSAKKKTPRVSHEVLKDSWSVRYVPSEKDSVREELSAFGQVNEIGSQHLLIIKPRNKKQIEGLQESLRKLLETGSIQFYKPVLRDTASNLHQIQTDEISVRFKEVPSPTKLKAIEKKYGVTVDRQNEFIPCQFIVKTDQSRGQDTLDVASELDSAADVEFATPNFISEHKR